MSVYNRREVLEACIRSLKEVECLDKFEIVIYDDCSTEFDESYLKKLIPFATRIHRNEQNLKADRNMVAVYQDFLNSDADYLFQVDSDVLFHRDILHAVLEVCHSGVNDAVFSFYNSNMHAFISEGDNLSMQMGDYLFGKKRDIGAVCVLFPRGVMAPMMRDLLSKDGEYKCFDWRWSAWLYAHKIPIWVTTRSLIQHIGFVGQNNQGGKCLKLDLGRGFTPTNQADERELGRLFQNLCLDFVERGAWLEHRANLYCKYRCIIRPIHAVRKVLIRLWVAIRR